MSNHKQIEKLMELSLKELRARFQEATGEDTRCPNKKWLARKVVEATAAKPAPAKAKPAKRRKAKKAESKKAADADHPAAAGETPLTKLSVEELRALYLERIGRETRSTDSRYLVWKLREAAKGRIPIGPRKTRNSDAEFKVLPLRLDTAAIEKMDQAWRELGIPSRSQFLRKAIGAYLEAAGKTEAAEALRVE